MKFNKHYQRRYRKSNHVACRRYEKNYIERVKKAVFSHYCKGKIRCQCLGCPIRHISLLSLDHVIPKRFIVKWSKRGNHWRTGKHGWNLWLWVKKKGYPKGFQILCMACNKAKGTKSRCPRYGKSH